MFRNRFELRHICFRKASSKRHVSATRCRELNKTHQNRKHSSRRRTKEIKMNNINESVDIRIREDIPPHEIYAGFMVRALARLINMVIGVALGIPAAIIMVIILLALGTEGQPETWQPAHSWIRFIIVIPCGFLYEAIAQSMGGADIGKALLGLRVVNESEKEATIFQGMIRNFAMIIDGLFFGLIGYSAMNSNVKNQRNGDKWAKTLVIKRKYLDKSVKWGVLKMTVANLIGILVWIGPMIAYDVNQVLQR
jgi:uncharacterized RDD family membrane protein YckC